MHAWSVIRYRESPSRDSLFQLPVHGPDEEWVTTDLQKYLGTVVQFLKKQDVKQAVFGVSYADLFNKKIKPEIRALKGACSERFKDAFRHMQTHSSTKPYRYFNLPPGSPKAEVKKAVQTVEVDEFYFQVSLRLP